MSIPITLEKTTTVIKYSVLSVWFIWVFLSLALLLSGGSDSSLVYTYFVYILFGTIVLILARKDIFSPPGIFTLFGFLGFGMNIPLIALGLAREVHITDSTLTKVLIVFLSAQIGFIGGYLSRLNRLMPTRWIVDMKHPPREASVILFVLLACYVVAAGLIRINYHLGEASIQPKILLAGYVKYILYEGVLILCLWYLAQGLKKGTVYVLLGLSLLLSVAVTQAFLGWRGGATQILILAMVLFWYQKRIYQKQKIHSFVWLLLILILMSSIVELGNSVRVQRIGGDKKFTQENFVRKMLLRGQGTTRLAAVVDYFGPITFTNQFLINKLISEGLSTTKYIDGKVYGLHDWQRTSFGTSGPGGPYTGLGLIGVLMSYGLLGVFCRSNYENIFISKTVVNPLGVVFYSLLVYCLLEMLNENFNLSSIKTLIAIGGQIFTYKLIFIQKLNIMKRRDKLIAESV